MAFPAPQTVAAHGVIGLAAMAPRDGAATERFIEAVRDAFPTLVHRQVIPPEAPPQTPHLVVQSTSSQLAVSGLQADLQVRFYGGFETDPERVNAYLREKMTAVLRGWQAVNAQLAFSGVIRTLQFPLEDESGVEHVLEQHVRPDLPVEAINDAKTQITFRVADHYYVSLTVANHEAKQISRPILPGVTGLVVAPWEGEVTERGVELAIDVNNRYKAVVERQHPAVNEEELLATLGVSERVAAGIGPEYAETGTINLESLQEEVA